MCAIDDLHLASWLRGWWRPLGLAGSMGQGHTCIADNTCAQENALCSTERSAKVFGDNAKNMVPIPGLNPSLKREYIRSVKGIHALRS